MRIQRVSAYAWDKWNPERERGREGERERGRERERGTSVVPLRKAKYKEIYMI